jgi:hypothetical protein
MGGWMENKVVINAHSCAIEAISVIIVNESIEVGDELGDTIESVHDLANIPFIGCRRSEGRGDEGGNENEGR